jgi:hypothetical protein
MNDPISATCRTTYHASRTSGTRALRQVKLIVLHSTETPPGSSASVARYFASAKAKGSAHLVVDDAHCYRTLPNDVVPWAAPGANEDGFHIEQCGYARWTTNQWKQHLPTLHRAAFKTALHCNLFNIPTVFLRGDAVRAGNKGITTHAQVTKAYPKLGTHTDPGGGWPTALFMSLVAHYRRELDT